MNISDYFAEIMKQQYSSNLGLNYTKVAILLYFQKLNYIFDEQPYEELAKFVYRFYSDNLNFAKEMNFVTIKNVQNYSPSDLIEYVKNELNDWCTAGNNIIQLSTTGFFTNKNLALELADVETLKSMVGILIKKYYGRGIVYDDDISEVFDGVNISKLPVDEYIKFINKTKFRNRAFENLNYCCCCDESHKEKLFAVHIDRCNNISDPDNSLIFCYEHAKLFVEERFTFNELGKIEINSRNALLDPRMRISQQVLPYKKRYLKKL